MYLVDTNVISAGAPAKTGVAHVVAWMAAHSSELYLSAVTVAEIEDGIAKLRRGGASRKADELAAWLETVLHLYGVRVLAFDLDTARVAGRFLDKARGLGLTPGFADAVIGATALHHGHTLLTRNVKDFAALSVAIHDPFVTLPT